MPVLADEGPIPLQFGTERVVLGLTVRKHGIPSQALMARMRAQQLEVLVGELIDTSTEPSGIVEEGSAQRAGNDHRVRGELWLGPAHDVRIDRLPLVGHEYAVLPVPVQRDGDEQCDERVRDEDSPAEEIAKDQ